MPMASRPRNTKIGAVDVVDAPAAEPASVGLLLAEDELDGPLHPLVFARVAVGGKHLEHAAGNIHAGRIEHGVVIREGDVLEDHLGVVFVEAAPAAVFALHGELPADGALGYRDLIALAGIVNLAQRKQNLRRIIGIRVKLVVELEVPAARLGVADFDGPIALVADLFGKHPVDGFDHARIVARHAGLAQRKDSLRRIPHRAHAGRHTEGWLGHLRGGRLLDAELFKFVAGADDLRIVLGVSEAAQRDDGVEHGGIDGAEAVAHLEAFEHPLFRAFEREVAERANVNRLRQVHDPVKSR